MITNCRGLSWAHRQGGEAVWFTCLHTSTIIHVCRIGNSETQNPQLAHADLSNKNPYLFKSTLCPSIFIWGFQIAFWGERHDWFHFTWLGQGLNQKPWLPYTFPSSVLLHREIHVGENFSLMRMLRMNTQNPFSAFSLLKLDSFSRTSINTVPLRQLNLAWKCTLSFLPCHGCLIK